jgi:hypothetical protein
MHVNSTYSTKEGLLPASLHLLEQKSTSEQIEQGTPKTTALELSRFKVDAEWKKRLNKMF